MMKIWNHLFGATILVSFLTVGGNLRAEEPFKVLMFTKTVGYDHGKRPERAAEVKKLGEKNGFTVIHSEDVNEFTYENLKQYKLVIFHNNVGPVLNDEQMAAFEYYIASGGGFMGMHAIGMGAWQWYQYLAGAHFRKHTSIKTKEILIEDSEHICNHELPNPWTRKEEWYMWKKDPRGSVHMLASVDISKDGGTEDHPISWCQEYDGGRSWYTGMGHGLNSFEEPLFLKHILGGILWASGTVDGDCVSGDTVGVTNTRIRDSLQIEPPTSLRARLLNPGLENPSKWSGVQSLNGFTDNGIRIISPKPSGSSHREAPPVLRIFSIDGRESRRMVLPSE